MRRTWKKAKPTEEKRFRVNEQIRVPEVFLIDENGENRGRISIQEALAMAREAESDLVEVNPKGECPVVKIMDYGQFKYEQEKKAHKQKVQQKKVELKCVRLSVRISQHDSEMRAEQAEKFLKRGDKLKIELMLKGREKQFPEKGAETIRDFVKHLQTREGLNLGVEQDLTKQGGRYNMVLFNRND
ncbi:MAG: Translation initiation factor IF-3 [Parcubacteria group bacterium ADurb.Bin316]|nr:MAG: Translation initiation factor IF-3 [Parcubacteria group bacterium ADurb.Bin316]HOZ55689.1 translation initiation factor IF-3 [bacterium]